MLFFLQQEMTGGDPETLAARLEAIGFRVLHRQEIAEPLQYFDTQEGAVFRRGGRLCRELPLRPFRELPLERSPWRFAGRGRAPVRSGSLAGVRRAVPWLPEAADLHPVLLALRSGVRLRVRGVATRDLTVVVERWRFAGTAPPANGHDRGPLDPCAFTALHHGAVGAAATVGQTPPRWYVAWSWPSMRARWGCGAASRSPDGIRSPPAWR